MVARSLPHRPHVLDTPDNLHPSRRSSYRVVEHEGWTLERIVLVASAGVLIGGGVILCVWEVIKALVTRGGR